MLSIRTASLCDAVEAEPKAAGLPAVVSSLVQVRSTIDGAPAKLAVSLAALSRALLEGVPFKLTRSAMQCTLSVVDKAYGSPQGPSSADQLTMLFAAEPLWASAILHLNRDVRGCSLALLARMLSHTAMPELPAPFLSTILRSGVVTHLITLLSSSSVAAAASAAAAAPTAIAPPPSPYVDATNAWLSSPGMQLPYALLALRGLLRAPDTAARFRADGTLAAALQALPPSSRQGAVGAATAELLLRLGELGRRSVLGDQLRARLLGRPHADEHAASMEYESHSSLLPMNRVVLAARAPTWLALLDAGSRPAGDPGEEEEEDDGDDTREPSKGLAHHSEGAACTWRLSEHEALALPHAACVVLYELVATGHAYLPTSLRPKVLLAAAERLGLKPLLMAPPTDAGGVPWLALHLGALAGSTSRRIAREASVVFELRDGARLAAHSCLLEGAEYFRTLLSFAGHTAVVDGAAGRAPRLGDGRHDAYQHAVRVDDAGAAAFGVLLCYVYTRIPPTAIESAMQAAATAAAGGSVAARGGTREHSALSIVGAPADELDATGGGGGGTTNGRMAGGESRLVSDAGALWRRLGEQADAADGWLLNRWRDTRGPPPPAATRPVATSHTKLRAAAPGIGAMHGRLCAADALELGVLAYRYLLDELAEVAHQLLRAALNADASRAAAEVVPLLLSAQEGADHAASEVIFDWAVDHYEQVHEVLSTWIGQFAELPSALPPVPRRLGEEALRGFEESLRAAMLKRRHGL